MRVLVTGGGGFLGRSVVGALLDRGHGVRVLLRPSSDPASLPWLGRVELFPADLRVSTNLESAFDGIDAVVHLAAAVFGQDHAQFTGTVIATERLLGAMARTRTQRLVLASSFAVYDWSAVTGTLDETSPVERDPYSRDGYAVAKVWQERVARRFSEQHGWALTVLRPGYIWGRGNDWPFGVGLRVGPVLAPVGLHTELPLTHVSNCTDCFARILEDERSVGQTYNVVDGYSMTSREYAARYRAATGRHARLIVIPYRLGMAAAWMVSRSVPRLARARLRRGEPRLPGIFVPCRFEARFKPLQYSNQKLVDELGWSPPNSMEQCLSLTFD